MIKYEVKICADPLPHIFNKFFIHLKLFNIIHIDTKKKMNVITTAILYN
jgi:hypothetical protein